MSFKYERFLIEAIEQCQLQKILTCIKHGHNIYIRNNHGQNLLVHLLKQQNAQDVFFEKKRLQIFQFLITQCNLSIDEFDYHGKNLFNWAANLNCTQEALYLLQSYPGDIDILIRDYSGLCSLHYAIEHGNEILVHAIVDYLLQYRIRFDIIDNHNNTPEELARKLGYDHISEYLADTSRSTVFMSRNIPFYQQRLSKSTLMTKVSMTTTSVSSSSSSTTSVLSITEIYQLIETKIEMAKNLNDWKTVALLRTYQRNLNRRKSNQLRRFIFKQKKNHLFLFH
jgi:ankyrin repeat protein